MTVTQLNPPIPLETPKGSGLAHLMIDYGPEFHLMWAVFLDANGECWTFQNPEIRAAKNVTLGRQSISQPKAKPMVSAQAIGTIGHDGLADGANGANGSSKYSDATIVDNNHSRSTSRAGT